MSTRSARNIGDDRAIAPEKRVEEARLPDVGTSGNHHRRTLAQHAPASGIGKQHVDGADDAGERVRDRRRLREVVALVGKIQRGFDTRQQIEERRVDGGDPRGQRPVQLVGRGAGLCRRRRFDQIGDGLGLEQIALAVQERPQRELARLGQPGSAPHRRANDPLEEDGVAMGADFGHVLAGVGVRRGEMERHRIIVGVTPGGIHHANARHASHARRRGGAWHQLPKDLLCARAAQTNDADGAAAWRRRHRDDGVVRSEHVTSPLYLRAMMTVFMKASPMLSDVTVGSSAMTMWTMRRS
jgi:hypothetical protein